MALVVNELFQSTTAEVVEPEIVPPAEIFHIYELAPVTEEVVNKELAAVLHTLEGPVGVTGGAAAVFLTCTTILPSERLFPQEFEAVT